MKTIQIFEKAKLSKQPDCMNVTVTVDSKCQDSVDAANKVADQAIVDVKAYCSGRGMKPKEIKLIEYKNSPIYQYVDKEVWTADKTYKTTSRERVFMGYQTTATLTFRFDFDMKTASVIFTELGEIKNISYNMAYALKNPAKHRNKVMAMAVKNARASADVLAEAAGTRVIAIKEIAYGAIDDYSPRYYQCESFKYEECAIEDLGVEDITISESLTVTFEIE
jgi:uncharacterized protein YggE